MMILGQLNCVKREGEDSDHLYTAMNQHFDNVKKKYKSFYISFDGYDAGDNGIPILSFEIKERNIGDG
jgi:hypothetical protein